MIVRPYLAHSTNVFVFFVFFTGGSAQQCFIILLFGCTGGSNIMVRSAHFVDERNPAPPKKPRHDSPVNANKQWFSMVSNGANGFCPPTVAFVLGPTWHGADPSAR